jgi:alpha-tubulin suppressor-like RCC1 family protein
MSLGAYHTCGVTLSGAAYCWGWNGFGQLGIDRISALDGGEPSPVAVATPLRFATISASRDHTCGLTATGAAYCWGRNNTGQLGDGTTADALTPRAVAGGLSFGSITTGLEHTCALTPAGTASCWGHNRNQASLVLGGQLGDGTYESRRTPTLLARAIPFVQLHAGWAFTCGRTATGAVYCWGSNAHGQIGVGDLTTPSFPTPTGVGGLP